MKFLVIIFLITTPAWADFNSSQLSFGLGMANVSFTETESGLKATPGASAPPEPASGSFVTTGAFIDWERFISHKLSYVGKLFFPLMPSPEGSFLYGGGGLNYYFNSISTPTSFLKDGTKITFTPTWRYYVGTALGAGYLIYNSETAKKTDTLIELSASAGAAYTKNKKWSYKAEGSLGRGIGFNSSTIGMRVLIGLAYNLD
jgi:hypothetical protein